MDAPPEFAFGTPDAAPAGSPDAVWVREQWLGKLTRWQLPRYVAACLRHALGDPAGPHAAARPAVDALDELDARRRPPTAGRLLGTADPRCPGYVRAAERTAVRVTNASHFPGGYTPRQASYDVRESVFVVRRRAGGGATRGQWDYCRRALEAAIGPPFPFLVGLEPDHRTDAVVGLAGAIYDDRAFDRMPILADALQDAGCDSAEALRHLCSQSPWFTRADWVLAFLLGA